MDCLNLPTTRYTMADSGHKQEKAGSRDGSKSHWGARSGDFACQFSDYGDLTAVRRGWEQGEGG
jgi:hypothetical protein